ncbi:hypothetical protein L6164_022584 [Bauhinia variegata]|uniref:Uncharacterized protein n=1 Tax=Bauhinia variegata TaxID=167791 RepID=A0ACB9MIJ7_BAUVA|nr:hypothetical protein L6164_022584 [Bauhinia variegata]
MSMDSILLVLFSLFICFSFTSVSSNDSEISYKDHCTSFVPISTPKGLGTFGFHHLFPLGRIENGYYTGGDRIVGGESSWQQNSFNLRTWNILDTADAELFKVQGSLTILNSFPFYYVRNNNTYGGRSYYGGQRRPLMDIKVDGFWSESSGKLCMVGTGTGYSKAGNLLHLGVVFRLYNVFNSSNIVTLINGSLESLSSENDVNYFEPITVYMLPRWNYEYSLDTVKAKDECSVGSDVEEGLPTKSFGFCSTQILRAMRGLRLEYSSDCNSTKNCTPFKGIPGHLPSYMSLKQLECDASKHRMRVQVRFLNTSYDRFYRAFNPKTMLMGEGWWNEGKNRLCVVACLFNTESLPNAHVVDCSVRLSLKIPSTWTIKETSTIVGKIWSNKTVNDSGYFGRILFRNEEYRTVGKPGIKYQYSQLEKVRKLCPRHKPLKNKGKMFPDAFSNNMKFDMSVRNSNRPVGWGNSVPLSVDDQFYERNMPSLLYSNSSLTVPYVNISSGGLFNISYQIGISPSYNSTAISENSLFAMSSNPTKAVKITAEGIYDSGTGSLCMVGCRNFHLNNRTHIAQPQSVDCEILIKFQFPPLYTNDRSFIQGSIESMRDKSDPLFFTRLDLSSAAFYTEAAARTVWRIDMEIVMVLISTTLACVFLILQIFHVRRNPSVLPLSSVFMLLILTLGHMIPLVLNFEALFSQHHNRNAVLGNVGWLEVNEIAVRLIKMVAFLLQFRLLQLTCSARKADESQKGLWIAEMKSLYATLPLYAAGFLMVLLLKWNKNVYGTRVVHSSLWEDLKSYGGLVLDGFLLPQIVLNMFSNLRDNALSYSFYFGTTFVRLLPHAYDLYRAHNYFHPDKGSYYYADPSADFYSTAWDIVIPFVGTLFAVIIYLQQWLGGQCILPRRFKGSQVYEKVPAVAEAETDKPDI